MQLVEESPGLALESDSIADPESLSPIETVPDANELPLLDVVDENAAYVPMLAAPEQIPATMHVSRIRRCLSVRALLAISAFRSGQLESQGHVVDPPLIAGARREGEPG